MESSAHIVGTAITAMNRRDRTAEDMAHQVVADALSNADVDPSDVNLVVFGNATAGRLIDQGCVRGQSFLRRSGLRNAGIVNVDNSCAGGSSALHMATLATLGGVRTVLAVGVEKMWTGDRTATLAGIEDGVPLVERIRMHETLENPSGSVLMALNASWTVKQMEERGATIEQFAAAAVKARHNGALNPNAQFQSEVTIDEVLGSAYHRVATDPADVLVVHRRGRRRGALGLAPARGTEDPGQHHPVRQRRHRLPRAAGRDRGGRMGECRHRSIGCGRRGVARRHQCRGALRARIAGLLQAGGCRTGHDGR